MVEDSRKTSKSDEPPPAFSSEPDYPENGSNLGRFRNLKKIGEGGQAAVYRAVDQDLSRAVALKVLSRNLRSGQDIQERFKREIRVQARLKIPGIVPVYQCGEDRGWRYFAMELVDGVSIDRYFTENKLELPEKLELIINLAEIIAELHSFGLRHRDLKPSNVMVDKRGELKLLDLGLVKAKEPELDNFVTRAGVVSGTPAFISPEQCDAYAGNPGKEYDSAAVDVYSLGLMSYELLTGCLPYAIEHLDPEEIAEIVKSEPPRPIREVNPDIPMSIAGIIMQTLEKDPSERPTAAGFAAGLKKHQISVDKKKSSSGIVAALVILAIVALLGIYLLDAFAWLKNKQLPIPNPDQTGPVKPADNFEPSIPLKPEPEKTKPAEKTPAVDSGPRLYVNKIPEACKADAEKTARKLNYLPGKGALFFRLPPNTILRIKNPDGMVLMRANSAIKRDGAFYRNNDNKAVIEISTPSGKDRKFTWTPEKGKVDVVY